MAPAQTDSARSPSRWPPLLRALRRAVRPDRARVAAYAGLAEAGLATYSDFLALHREWIRDLARGLTGAGVAVRLPLPDGEGLPGPEPFGPDGSGTLVPPPPSRAQALGQLYVLEAFRLGCSVLERRVRGCSRGEGQWWMDLAPQLAGVPAEEQAAVVESARKAFDAWRVSVGSCLAGIDPDSPRAEAA